MILFHSLCGRTSHVPVWVTGHTSWWCFSMVRSPRYQEFGATFTISHLTSSASSSAARLSLPAAWRRIKLNRSSQGGVAHEKISRCELEHAGCSFSPLCRQLLIPVLPSSLLSHTQAFLYEPHSDSSVTNIWDISTDVGRIKLCLQPRIQKRIQWSSAWLLIRIPWGIFKTSQSPGCIPDYPYPNLEGMGPRHQYFWKLLGDSQMQRWLRPAGLNLPTEEPLEGTDDFCTWESEGKIWTKLTER